MKNSTTKAIVFFLGTCAFVMNITWFMSYPILSVFLNKEVGLSFAAVGAILGGVAFSARFLPVLGGYIADRTSQVHCLFLGIFLRVIGFASFAFVHNTVEVVAALVLNSIGSVLFDPSVRALISTLPEKDRAEGFTHLNLFLNAGVIAGPLLGALLAGYDARMPFFVSSLLLAILGAGGLLLWKILRQSGQMPSEGWSLRTLIAPLLDPSFRGFAFSVVVANALLSQIHYTLPIYNYLLSNSLKSMSSVYIVNGSVGLIAMFLLKKQIGMRSPYLLSALGVLCIGLGLVAIPLISASWWVLLCIGVFTVGETLVLPTHEIATSQLANKDRLGQYFGTLEMCGGLGMTVATAIGPRIAEVGSTSFVPWMGFGVCAVLLFAFYFGLYRRMALARGGVA